MGKIENMIIDAVKRLPALYIITKEEEDNWGIICIEDKIALSSATGFSSIQEALDEFRDEESKELACSFIIYEKSMNNLPHFE